MSYVLAANRLRKWAESLQRGDPTRRQYEHAAALLDRFALPCFFPGNGHEWIVGDAPLSVLPDGESSSRYAEYDFGFQAIWIALQNPDVTVNVFGKAEPWLKPRSAYAAICRARSYITKERPAFASYLRAIVPDRKKPVITFRCRAYGLTPPKPAQLYPPAD